MNVVQRSLALSLLALAQCGGARATRPVAAPAPALARAPIDASVTAPIDLSEVPAPSALLAMVRCSSIDALITHGASLTMNAPERARVALDQLIDDSTRLPGVAAIVDHRRPVELAAMHDAQDNVQLVLSVPVSSADDVQRALAGRVTLRPLGNGVRAVVRAQAPEDGQSPPCVIAPTPRPAEARLVCAQTEADAPLEAVAAFMARTVSGREIAQDSAVFTAFPAAIRAARGEEALERLALLQRSLEHELDAPGEALLRHPDVRASLRGLAGELVANLRAGWSEARSAEITITMREQQLQVRGGFELQNTSAPWLLAALESARNAPPIDAQRAFQRLPSGAIYLAGSVDAGAFARSWQRVSELAAIVAQREARARPAQATALRQAMDAMAAAGPVRVYGSRSATARAQSRVALQLEFAQPAHSLAWIAATRALVPLLQRPAVAAPLSRALARPMGVLFGVQLELAQSRVAPAAGWPANTLLLSLVHRPEVSGARSATPRAMQLALVPEGATLTVIYAADAREPWRAMQTPHEPELDLAALAPRAGALTVGVVPASVLALARSAGDTSLVEQLEPLINGARDRGRAPLTLRIDASERDGLARFGFAIDAPPLALALARLLAI